MNKKLAYIDCNNPYYAKLSDEDINMLKKINPYGLRGQLRDCPTHGLHVPVLFKIYDDNGNETNRFGCVKCFVEKEGK